MTGTLVELSVSNLLLSLALGLVAYAVHRRGRYPALAHLLWVLVLVKAITPPLLVLPITIGIGGTSGISPAAASSSAPEAAGGAGSAGAVVTSIVEHGGALLLLAWLVGSVAVMVVSTRRIWRFDRLLRHTSMEAPPSITTLARTVAFELGLRAAPTIWLSSGNLSPMTWWTGRRLRVVLPAALPGEVDEQQLRWVLAHELAHIKRHDHLVRWVEWFAGVVFWWNPVVWWARHNLHLDEEDACDALVLEQVQGQPRSYARTLLAVVEVLSSPGAPTPSVATGMGAAQTLEHRLTRIVAPAGRRRAPRYVVAVTVTASVAVMALGVGLAPDGPAAQDVTTATVVVEAAEPVVPPVAAPQDDRYTRVSSDVGLTASSDAFGATVSTAPIAAEGVVIGTHGADTYAGSAANETIVGKAGDDKLGGGPGRDLIRGGGGADKIRGGNGADMLAGDAGADTIGGGAGNDTISGGGGPDIIQGGHGRDTVDAGAGNDIVRTWADGTADQVDCGSGKDKAVVDSSDTVLRCEIVLVRDGS